MIIYIKNKHSLKIDDFYLKCCIGKNGLSKNKKEGDKKTPIGRFSIEKLYYRSDRIKKPLTRLKCIKIQKEMGWCDDPLDKENYMAIITTSVDENIKIPNDSVFKISNNGFIGSPYIEIQIGTSQELLKNNDFTINNVDAVSLEEIINNFIFK